MRDPKNTYDATNRLISLRRYVSPVVTLLVHSLMSGCGLTNNQTMAISTFTPAASNLGAIASSELIKAREVVIAQNECLLALKQGKDPGQSAALSNSPATTASASNVKRLDDPLTPAVLSTFIKAADLLKSYSEIMSAVAFDTQRQELTSAADQLTASLRSYDSSKKLIGDDELKSIGKGIVEIGGLIVEKKKVDALKAVIPPITPVVEKIALELAYEFTIHTLQDSLSHTSTTDNNSLTSIHLGILDVVYLKALKVRGTADRFLEQPRPPNYEELAVNCRNNAVKAMDAATSLSKGLVDSTEQLIKAQEALVRAIQDDSLTLAEIETFSIQLKELEPILKAISGTGTKIHL